jgi:hypothetical protein
LFKGRPNPNATSPGNQGICSGNSSHDGWTIGACSWTNSIYLYAERYADCTAVSPTSPRCWKAYGPFYSAIPSKTINFQKSDFTAEPWGSFQRFYTDNSTYDLGVYFRRCTLLCGGGCANSNVYANRHELQLDVRIYAGGDTDYCVNSSGGITTRRLNVVSAYHATYISEPYTASQMISQTLRLKELLHTDSNYCDAAETQFAIGGGCPYCNNSTLSGYPTSVPQTIPIYRTA